MHNKSLSFDHGNRELRTIHNMFFVIPTLYIISILLTFYSVKLSIIFPIVMIPTLLLLKGLFGKNDGVIEAPISQIYNKWNMEF